MGEGMKENLGWWRLNMHGTMTAGPQQSRRRCEGALPPLRKLRRNINGAALLLYCLKNPMPRAIIAPSVLASDFGQLTAECKRMIKGGAEWLHMGMSSSNIP